MNTILAGIDACAGGWVLVLAQGPRPLRLFDAAVRKTFVEIMEVAASASTVAVDIPIGLMDRGFRECDLRAREMMGRYKFRVFKTSPRRAIQAKTVAERHRMHRELTGQGLPPPAAAFAPKVAEANTWMVANDKSQDRVFEVHPELCFMALNGRVPVAETKHRPAGLRVRYSLLRPFFKNQDVTVWVRDFLRDQPRSQVKENDAVDAIVACVTAGAWAASATIPGPEPPRDSEGLYMRMRCPVIPGRRGD